MGKVYVISCSPDLASMGLDRLRTSVDGLKEVEISLDWSCIRLVPIIATEKVHFEEGEAKIVSIEPVTIPPYALPFNAFYGMNGMGFISCIGSLDFKRYDEERAADKAMFHSRIKASVMPGDLLGQISIVQGKKK